MDIPVIQTFDGHANKVWGCCFSNDGNRVISASDDKTVKIWNVHTGECIATLTGHTSDVGFDVIVEIHHSRRLYVVLVQRMDHLLCQVHIVTKIVLEFGISNLLNVSEFLQDIRMQYVLQLRPSVSVNN